MIGAQKLKRRQLSDIDDDSEPEWDYQTLTEAQQGTLLLAVLEKVGQSFVDR